MLIQVIEWILILLGHVAISCVMFNFVHATATPLSGSLITKKFTEKLILGFAVLPIMGWMWSWARAGSISTVDYPAWILFYITVAKVVGLFFLVRWFYRVVTKSLPTGAKLVSSQYINIQSQHTESLLDGAKARLFGLVPFNQLTKLQVEYWDFEFPQLPDALVGFRICQLSDLHFTQMIKPEYFQTVVDLANDSQPDLIIVTGDIVEKQECLSWIGQVLGRLTARHGVYYVLGNHDRLVPDQNGLRRRLNEAGLRKAANGKWHSIQIEDARLFLAGNEMPWYREANALPRELSKTSNDFAVLLSHSPDQIGWAVHRDFDLMFAGHTHGGQIRLPLVGPIIAPSRYGIKYASGTFQTRNTLMHVSRGISGDEPVRINCPPELGIFTLRKSG